MESGSKKGSVRLDYYLSGTLIGTLEDERYNGELVQLDLLDLLVVDLSLDWCSIKKVHWF